MRIVSAASRVEALGLTRPYTIAFRRIESVENAIVRLVTDSGLVGLGAASPEPKVTGETIEACRSALARDRIGWLIGREVSDPTPVLREIERRMPPAPAARAAVDMAIHDLAAQERGVPLVEMLGRAHDALPTSITIGIKPLEETLAEAAEYVSRGFRILKVKIGLDLERTSSGSRAFARASGPGSGSAPTPIRVTRSKRLCASSARRPLWISSSWSSRCRRMRSKRCARCRRRSASGSPPTSRS